MQKEAQTVPVRIYQSGNHVMLAAPMPGLEPQDISISIADHTIRIHGEERGPRQDNLELLITEWWDYFVKNLMGAEPPREYEMHDPAARAGCRGGN